MFEFHTRLWTCLPVSQYIQRYATSNVSQHSGLCECADYKVGAVRLTNHIQTTTIHLELYLVVLVLVVTIHPPACLSIPLTVRRYSLPFLVTYLHKTTKSRIPFSFA